MMCHRTGQIWDEGGVLMMRVCVCVTAQSAVASTGEICSLLLNCVLPSRPPPFPCHLTSPRLTSLFLEAQTERLAPSRRLHPWPLDPHPACVFQDVRHEAPQTHLLRRPPRRGREAFRKAASKRETWKMEGITTVWAQLFVFTLRCLSMFFFFFLFKVEVFNYEDAFLCTI